MGEKRLKASIIIGGLIDGTLRTAITDTKAGFRQIGDALKAASKAQKSLTTECLAFQSAGRNITGITERYDRLKTAIDHATQATRNLRKAEAFKDRMDRRADQMRSMAGRAGMGALASGAFLGTTLHEAAMMQTETARLNIMGIPETSRKEALAAGRSLKNFGTTIRENVAAFNDGLAVFGSMHEARMAAPVMAKMTFANHALFGTSKEEAEHQQKNMLRVIDIRGGATSSEQFAQQSDLIQKAFVASKGMVNGSAFFKAVSHGGTAIKGMNNEALYFKSIPMIQEMGGDQFGTAAQTAYNSLVQGHTSKRAVLNLMQAGLIADTSKVRFDKNGLAAQINPGALKGSGLYTRDPFEWVKSVMLPSLVATGTITRTTADHALKGSLTDTEKQRLNTVAASLGNTNTGKFLSTIATSLPQIDRDSQNARNAAGVNASVRQARNTAAGQQLALRANITNIRTNLGETILPTYTALLGKANTALEKLNGLVTKHPKLTRIMMIGTVAVTGALAASIPVLLIAGAALNAWGGYAALAARREALLTAAQLRQTTATIAEASAEKTAALTRAGGWKRVFSTMKRAPGAMTGCMKSLFSIGTITGGLTTLIEGVGIALSALVSPVGLVAGAIVVGGLLIWKYWKPIKAFMSGFGEGLMEAFAPVMPVITRVWNSMTRGVRTAWHWIMQLFQPVHSTRQSLQAAGSAGHRFGLLVGKAIKGLIKVFKVLSWVSPIGQIVHGAMLILRHWKPLKTFFGQLFKSIGHAFDSMTAKALKFIEPLQWLFQHGRNLLNHVSTTGSTPLNKLEQGAKTTFSWLGGANAVQPALPQLAPAGTGAREGDSHYHTYNITQQPGQSPQELAREIARIHRSAGRAIPHSDGAD